jgi:hypothetical protein
VLNNALRYTDPTGHAFDAGGGAGDLEAWMRLLPQNPSRAFNGWLHERDVAWAVLLYNQWQGASPEVIADLQAGLASREANLTTNGYRGAAQAVSAAFDAAAPGVGPGLLGFTAGLSALGAPALTNVGGALAGAENGMMGAAATVGQKVYRVFGNRAKAYGRSWTPIDPRTVPNYAEAAGLPEGNSGKYLSEGTLINTQGVQARTALQVDTKYGLRSGGLPEYVVPDPKNQIDDIVTHRLPRPLGRR